MKNHRMRTFVWLLVAILGSAISAEVKATIVLDRSPSLYGNSGSWSNQSNDQNFAENFLFNTPVQLTGMDIYGEPNYGFVGSSTTIRLWSDSASLPQTLLANFTELISIFDSAGASAGISRKHVDFTTPINLAANTTYWIGMSGTGYELAQVSLLSPSPGGDGAMAQFSNTTYAYQTLVGDMAYRLHGEALVPEPSSLMVCGGLAWAALAVVRGRKLIR